MNENTIQGLEPIRHTVDSFLTRPGDKGDSTGNNRIILSSYENKLSKIISSKKFNFNPQVLFKDNLTTYIKISVPSESVDDVYYDVVVEFDGSKDSSTMLNHHPIRIFSNAPSFVFTYAHAFMKQELLCMSLRDKLPLEINEYSGVRNPNLLISYEKTIVLALLYIKHYDLMNKTVCLKHEIKTSFPRFKESIATFEEKFREYNNKKRIKINENKAKRAKKDEFGRSNTGVKRTINLDTRTAKRSAFNHKATFKVNSKIKNTQANMKVNHKVNSK